MTSKSRIKQKKDKPGESFRIPWAQLGWRSLRGPVEPADGPLRILVVAPWCPDCVDVVPKLAPTLARKRTVVAGEFADSLEILDFLDKCGVSREIPVFAGTREKSEIARNEARFRHLRAGFGDSRRWGVPSLLEGRLVHGEFIAEKFSDPSA